MKRFIIVIITVLMVILLTIASILLASRTVVSPTTSTSDLDIYNIATKITKYDFYTDVQGNDVYYFYQETCSHCEDLKPVISGFYTWTIDNDYDLKIIDMADEANSELWEPSETFSNDPTTYGSLSEIKVVGTPSLVIVKDGVVVDYWIGNLEIEEGLSAIAKSSN